MPSMDKLNVQSVKPFDAVNVGFPRVQSCYR